MNLRLLSAVLLLGMTPALAQSRDVAYFCTAEASGGITYNSAAKHWEGTPFRPTDKFVLKLQYLATRQSDTIHLLVNVFKVTITEYGENNAENCINFMGHDQVEVPTSGFLVCNTIFKELRFNPSNLRFIRYYQYGYINGKDSNDDTPAVDGGTCTKIP